MKLNFSFSTTYVKVAPYVLLMFFAPLLFYGFSYTATGRECSVGRRVKELQGYAYTRWTVESFNRKPFGWTYVKKAKTSTVARSIPFWCTSLRTMLDHCGISCFYSGKIVLYEGKTPVSGEGMCLKVIDVNNNRVVFKVKQCNKIIAVNANCEFELVGAVK